MTVQDPHMASGVTEMYRSGGYNPSTYTSSPTYASAKKEETLPDWVVNNNKVTPAPIPPPRLPSIGFLQLCKMQSVAGCEVTLTSTFTSCALCIVNSRGAVQGCRKLLMLNIWCLVQVLRWYGYFKEAVTESAVENYRVRKVVIFFYLEDNSCQVVEPKEDNSGLPQVTPPLCPQPCHHTPLYAP